MVIHVKLTKLLILQKIMLEVIEDAAQGVGVHYKGNMLELLVILEFYLITGIRL